MLFWRIFYLKEQNAEVTLLVAPLTQDLKTYFYRHVSKGPRKEPPIEDHSTRNTLTYL